MLLEGGPQFLTGCWLEATLRSLPLELPYHGRLLHQNRVSRESPARWMSQSFYNPTVEVTSIILAVFYSLETRGEDDTWTGGPRDKDPWVHLCELPTTVPSRSLSFLICKKDSEFLLWEGGVHGEDAVQ